MIKTRKGDLIQLAKEGNFDVIVHGANCFCTMGAGIARQIKQNFPLAFLIDCKTKKGDKKKLGTCSHADYKINNQKLTIVNAYTQYDYKGHGVKINYQAVRSCMKKIKEIYSSKRIALPKIGSGLARGDWNKIYQIIKEELDREDVTIVEFGG